MRARVVCLRGYAWLEGTDSVRNAAPEAAGRVDEGGTASDIFWARRGERHARGHRKVRRAAARSESVAANSNDARRARRRWRLADEERWPDVLQLARHRDQSGVATRRA